MIALNNFAGTMGLSNAAAGSPTAAVSLIGMHPADTRRSALLFGYTLRCFLVVKKLPRSPIPTPSPSPIGISPS